MKRIEVIILTALMVLTMSVQAFATLPAPYKTGFSGADQTKLNHSGVYDYRYYPAQGRNDIKEKPASQFSITVNGNATYSDNGRDLDTDPQCIEVNSNDKISVLDASAAYGSDKLTKMDLQYLIVPDGETRDVTKIKETMVPIGSRFKEIKYFEDAIAQAKQTGKDCYVELYEAVADMDSAKNEGWSDNGTYGMEKTTDPKYPQGITWYFTTMLVKVNAGTTATAAPDFWPSVPSLTYTGTPGSTITIPSMVYNSGVDGTTDFAAAWNGSGWNNPVSVAKNITINQGQKADTPVAVIVPATATKLWLKVNTDGNTPSNELNQANNIVGVTVGPKVVAPAGVDISITGSVPMSSVTLTSSRARTAVINYTIKRKDAGATTITAVLTMISPDGTKTQTVTLAPGQTITRSDSFSRSAAGTYTFRASVWPSGVTDTYQSNNVCGPYNIRYIKAPSRTGGDTGIEGQLGG